METIHSADLAAYVGVSGAVVRRDLSYVGSYGTRGVGYPVAQLREQVNQSLGLAEEHRMVVVGVGHLGRAVAGYSGFAERGLRVVGLFDVDPDLLGSKIVSTAGEYLEIMPLTDLPAFVSHNSVAIGVIATPAPAAQSVTDLLVEAGVTSILNLCAVHVTTPAQVVVRPVDLATEIQILAVHAAQQGVR